MNPNNIKAGDIIEVEQAWEDEAGNLHNEFPVVLAVDNENGRLTLDFGTKQINEFLESADFYAKDYEPEHHDN